MTALGAGGFGRVLDASSALGVLFLALFAAAVVGAAVANRATALDWGPPPRWAEAPPAVSVLGYSLYIQPVALSMLSTEPAAAVRRATHGVFLTTFLLYEAASVKEARPSRLLIVPLQVRDGGPRGRRVARAGGAGRRAARYTKKVAAPSRCSAAQFASDPPPTSKPSPSPPPRTIRVHLIPAHET